MPNLVIKPEGTSGNKLIIQDQAGGAVLTTADSGATISGDTAINTTGALTVTNTGLNYIGDAASDGEAVLNLVDTNAGNETMALECINDSATVGTATAIGFQAWSGSHTGKIVATLDPAGLARTNFDFHLHNGANADSRFKIGYDGDVTVKTGDLIFGTAGKGIVLGATTNVAANTLDDYEEGYTTFSSGYTNGGGGTQNFYSSNSMYNVMSYTKIGRTVTVQGMFIFGGYTGTDGALRIGLPFTVGAAHGGISQRACAFLHNTGGGTNTKNYSVGTRGTGDSYMVVHQTNSGSDAGSLANSSDMGGNGNRVSFSLTYFTDQ